MSMGRGQRLMAPELVEEFVRRSEREQPSTSRRGAISGFKSREFREVSRKLNGFTDAVAEELRAPDVQLRLDELEARKVHHKGRPKTERPSRDACLQNVPSLDGMLA